MAQLFVDISQSLDGFAAGTDIGPDLPLGRGGEALHGWQFGHAGLEPAADDRKAAARMFEGTGAFIMGRRTFELGLPYWGEDGTFRRPCFVVTGRPQAPVRHGATVFTFVAGNLAAVRAAGLVAAASGNVCLMGGPGLVRQFIAAGLVDRINLHLAHVALGAGERLFDGSLPTPSTAKAVSTALATHIRLRLRS